jgi:hypothetical protein
LFRSFRSSFSQTLVLKLPTISAAAVTAATAATTSTATAAALATTVFSRTSFVDDHIAAVVFLPVKLRDGCVCSIIVSHFYKTKTARTAGLTIVNDIGRLDGTCRCKIFLQILTSYTKRQVSNVKFITHFPLYFLFPEEAKKAGEVGNSL